MSKFTRMLNKYQTAIVSLGTGSTTFLKEDRIKTQGIGRANSFCQFVCLFSAVQWPPSLSKGPSSQWTDSVTYTCGHVWILGCARLQILFIFRRKDTPAGGCGMIFLKPDFNNGLTIRGCVTQPKGWPFPTSGPAISTKQERLL